MDVLRGSFCRPLSVDWGCCCSDCLEFGAMDNVEIADSLSLLMSIWAVCNCTAILCFDLWQQCSAIRLREESGQSVGFHLLPCGVAALTFLGRP